MKRLVLASLAIAFAAAPALAADMPVKAAPPVPPPVYNWTGYYFGGFVGGLWSTSDSNFVTPPAANIHQTHTSGIGGTFFGAQAQYSWWLVGIEFGVGEPFSRNFGSGTCSPVASCAAGFTTTETIKNGIFTAGGRLGLAFDRWLIYGAGGGTFTDFDHTNCTTATCPLETATGTFKGFYVGGGFDWSVYGGWIVGFEFRHTQFDTQGLVPINIATRVPNPADGVLSQLKFNTAVFRLTYLFGAPPLGPTGFR